ncbi:MAG: BREX-1 system adenine-specific DNA-methyltransferase PglX [Ruminococcus sp.]
MNKTAIKNFAVEARVMLINAVTQLAYEFEVTENGTNDPAQESVNGRSLTAAEKNQRSQLIANIRQNGFTQTMEEAAYTWFNRFIALRFMEVNNYLPSHTRIFSDESGNFKPEVLSDAANVEIDGLDKELILELLENQENERLYKYIIITQCNALNKGLPEMFEQIGGWTELLFPRNLLREDSVIAKMITEIPEEDWRDQVQIIGWLYQYYNTEPKDKVFADLKKNIKISAQAIPAATQLFTPDWIVRYMVENSLGRLWAEGHGKPDDADWKYYLDEAEQEDSVKAELEKIRAEYKNIQPENIKIIDPCMGSGHILVYAFDVLIDIYRSCGWGERDAAKSILRNNLYGLDIDRRAYQLAYFAVMMKARQYNRRICSPENQPNLANFADVMGADTDMLSGSIRRFAEQFAFADTYGSLMTVTAPADIDTAFSDFMPTFGLNMRQFDMMMKIYTILGQKYDVVCTNPPYMGGSGMNAKLSDFVKNNFADYKSDLFSAFMVKIFDWCKPNGQIGLVTPYVWMFIQSYEKLRQLVYASTSITSMIQLEYNAFESACVPVATFTLCKSEIKTSGEYIKLSDFKGIENQEPKTLEAINNSKCGYRYTAKQENFSKIPGMPVAYWVSEAVNRCFEKGLKFDEFASPKQGIKTADKDRFLRFWHEINYERSSIFDSNIDKWFPCNKGGAFRKWYGNNEYVVNWENDGYEICNFKDENGKMKSRPQNLPYMLKEGLTYTNISSSTFGVRYSPPGFIYDASGSLIYVENKKMYYALGLLASNIVLVFTRILSPTMSFEVGQIASIPVYYKPNSTIDSLVKENIELSKKDWDSFETSWDFEGHPLV